jgi:hypothetical protein
MSLSTTIAKGAARGAALRWDIHRLHCYECAGASQRRRPGERCAEGQDLALDKERTAETAKAEAAKDAEPNERQGTLW